MIFCERDLNLKEKGNGMITMASIRTAWIFLMIGMIFSPSMLYAEQDMQPLQLKSLVQEVSVRNSKSILKYMKYEMTHQTSAYEKGVFEPDFFATASHKDIKVPNTVQELVSRGFQNFYTERSEVYGLGVRGLAPTGAKWELGFDETARASSLIDQYRPTYSKEYQGSLNVKIRQPILRGFGSDSTRAKIDLSVLDSEIALKDYEQSLMEVVGVTIRSYWELYGALQLRKSREKSLVNFKTLLNDVKRRAFGGKVAKTEIIEAESAVSQGKAELLAATYRVNEKQNQIMMLLNTESSEKIRSALDVLQQPSVHSVSPPSFEDGYNQALKNWPNLKSAEIRVARADRQLMAEKNNALPQLDFVGSYGTSSLSTSFSKAESSAFTGQTHNWSVGMEFSIPVMGGARGKSRLAMAQIGSEQANAKLIDLKRSISNSLRSKMNQLMFANQQLIEYKRGLSSQKLLLNAERNKFSMGKSDVRSVVSREGAYIRFQRMYLDSLVKLKLAEVSLDAVEGVLLARYGVELKGRNEQQANLRVADLLSVNKDSVTKTVFIPQRSRKVTPKVAAKASHKVAAKVAAKASHKVTAKVVAKASHKVTAKVVTKASRKVAAKVVAKASHKVAAKAVVKASHKVAAKAVAKASHKVAAKAVAKASHKVTAKVVANASHKVTAKVVTKASHKVAPKVVAKASHKVAAKAVVKASQKVTAKAVAKGSHKVAAKAVAKASHKVAAKAVAKASHKVAAKAVAKAARKNSRRAMTKTIPHKLKYYSIRVASYANTNKMRKVAHDFMTMLQKAGYPVYMRTTKKWLVVALGDYNSSQNAAKVVEKLVKKFGVKKVFIIKHNTPQHSK